MKYTIMSEYTLNLIASLTLSVKGPPSINWSRLHSSRMRSARSLPYRGVSVQGSLSRGSLSMGLSVRETPLEATWDQGQRPPERNMGPGSQTGSDIIRRPLPSPWTERQTCLETLPWPKLCLLAVTSSNKHRYSSFSVNKSFCQICQNSIREK